MFKNQEEKKEKHEKRENHQKVMRWDFGVSRDGKYAFLKTAFL